MTPDYSAYHDIFQQDGFVVVRRFLPADELAELTREIARFMRDVAPHLPQDQAFYHERPDGTRALRQIHRMNCDPFFETYRRHPRWHALGRALVGEPVRPNTPMWLNKPANTHHVTPPHQDNRYFCLVPPHAAMIFVALQPIDEENGCLRYVRGSHRRGMRPHALSGVRGFSKGIVDFGPADEAAEVLVQLEPGDACCHHPEIVHRADANRSATRSREAFAIVFEGESCRVDTAAFDAYQRDAQRWDVLR